MHKLYACVVLVIIMVAAISYGSCSEAQSDELMDELLHMLVSKNRKADAMNHGHEKTAKTENNVWEKLAQMLFHPDSKYSDPATEVTTDATIETNDDTIDDATDDEIFSANGRPHHDRISIPVCGYGEPVCECDPHADECSIFLEIDEIMTFTSYGKNHIGKREGLAMRGKKGALNLIDKKSGKIVPHPSHVSSPCAANEHGEINSDKCTEPQFVDGKNYRMVIGVNGQVPGPTIVAHENQMVRINVHNNLSSEGISIHWHGMHQWGTPWMDGVGQVTQCQIGPSSSYSYIYKARPAGTFWYHSHSGAQRTDGFYGNLIIKESGAALDRVRKELPHSLEHFQDYPDIHSLSFLDWQHESSLPILSQSSAGLGVYPDVPVGELPSACDESYRGYRNVDNSGTGITPFYSGLINGMGRHKDVPYSQTRLSVFPVVEGGLYRFRLIGAQGVFAYKYSIDGHKLTVVGTDGYWIEPVERVDYIIIHAGERYDFLLRADQNVQNYWMRAETLEINKKGSLPYQSMGHVAEGILQYTTSVSNAETIPSTAYEEIKLSSPKRQCSLNPCRAVNCPFKNYHDSYHTTCINVGDLKLLLPTDKDELPKPTADDCVGCLQFFNFNFEGDSDTSSINGRNFISPPVPPQTQPIDFENQAVQCDLTAECNLNTLACSCTHMVKIPFNKTVQFVLSSFGRIEVPHPVHLHGHTFHVTKIGYPDYDPDTGFISDRPQPGCDVNVNAHNKDIECYDVCDQANTTCPENKHFEDGCHPYRCTKPGWKNGGKPTDDFCINSHTIRKDTVMVPAGGYVVINFISDNPGHWFMHCHIEPHQIQGMAVIVHEGYDVPDALEMPPNLNKCGDFSVSTDSYKNYVDAYQKMLGKNTYE